MSYKKFDQADLEVIKNIIKDDERILYAENINEEYSHDELGGAQSYPDVVVKATSPDFVTANEVVPLSYDFIFDKIIFGIVLSSESFLPA